MDPLEELRQLLLRRERERLGELQTRLDDKERRTREVAGILPQAIRLSRERGADLNRALQPTFEESIQTALERRPEIFVEALAPIIGSIVRRSIAESLRGLVQSLNKTLEHTFSVQGLKWRYEAFRTGKSFAEVVMLRSMVYRVEELFLIHRETSLTLLHVSADGSDGSDSDLVAGMLSAIRDFARDALKAGADDSLDEFRIGDLEGWIASGRHAYLAAAIRGTPPRELRTTLDETIENVHILKGVELAHFDGDASVFEPLRPELENCLRAQYRQEKAAAGGAGQYAKAFLAIAAVAAVLIFGAFLAIRSSLRWQDFLHGIDNEPGLAVTSSHHAWWGHSRVDGLRDPLASDPTPLARAAGFDPVRVDFHWKSYLALDDASTRRRFEQRFPLAPGTRAEFLGNGIVTLSGSAPYEWIERVRRAGTEVPGVIGVNERDLRLTYDPVLALARFEQAYPLPPEIRAQVADGGVLMLSGAAPYEWIAPVREGAPKLPGISAISETDLQVTYEPKLVMDRFTARFGGIPDTINVRLQNGLLTLNGQASHGWLSRVREDGVKLPGITAINHKSVIDLDAQAFQQSKAVIENANVYFLPAKDNFASEGFAALSRLPDEIRRCTTNARHIGLEVEIQLFGSADATGPEAKNLELSQRRANAVRDFLVSCGLNGALFRSMGTGAPPPAASENGKPAAPEQSQRRVAFRVETRISSPP